MLLQAGNLQQLETLNPRWDESVSSPPSLPRQRWMMLFGLGSNSFTGQSSFQHPSTLSWKEALNISLQLLITCNELLWKCVFFFHRTLSVVIGSYSCRVVQCDGGNAAVNAHPLPARASLSHKAAVQPGGGIIFVCVDRYLELQTPRGFTHTESRDVFIWAFGQVTTKPL